jgi:hypothetical protein
VKLMIEQREGMRFEFWGGMTVGFNVVQSAEATQATWIPGTMTRMPAGACGHSRFRGKVYGSHGGGDGADFVSILSVS